MCLHCKGLHISLVCVNIPIVELLLSWLGLFHLSSIINDLLPVVMPCVNLELLTQNRVLMGEQKPSVTLKLKYFQATTQNTNRGGCWSIQEIWRRFSLEYLNTPMVRIIKLKVFSVLYCCRCHSLGNWETLNATKFMFGDFNQSKMSCIEFLELTVMLP